MLSPTFIFGIRDQEENWLLSFRRETLLGVLNGHVMSLSVACAGKEDIFTKIIKPCLILS